MLVAFQSLDGDRYAPEMPLASSVLREARDRLKLNEATFYTLTRFDRIVTYIRNNPNRDEAEADPGVPPSFDQPIPSPDETPPWMKIEDGVIDPEDWHDG